jgi:hypothetical protein
MTLPPGEGERRAQAGLIPQYKVAAEKIYALLAEGWLHEVGIADPEAETLDDIQLVRRHGSELVLDAYQVKWGGPGGVLAPAEFQHLLAELIAGRKAVIEARAKRVKEGAPTVARVIAHLFTSRAPSTFSRAGDALGGEGRTLHAFLEEAWRPAQRELITRLSDIDAKWRDYITTLAADCGLAADELLGMATDLRIEVGRELAEETIESTDWQSRDYLEDLLAIRGKLQDLVSNRQQTYVWVTADELVGHLGPEWQARWQPRQSHVFPLRDPYEPLESTAENLRRALDRFDQGYVVLTGSPGAGKSTLLTRQLRADPRLAAHYYAYIPDNDSRLRGEAGAFLHDLFLAISTRRGRHVPSPRRGDLDALHGAFRQELRALGEQASRTGQTEVILIDGLDHVGRDPRPHHPLLNELPLVGEIPDGVLFVIGTRSLSDLPAHVEKAVVGDRHVDVSPLSRAAVIRLAEQEELGEVGDTIATLSGGHPLLAQTYLKLAKEADPSDRETALDALPANPGEVWNFYDSVWETVSADPELIGLLGMVSRMRGTIRLPWLLETGSGADALERLRKLGYLFSKSGADRWTFFHSSFREFLRARTSELGGEHNEALHRKHHADLAERCRNSGAQSPERFDRLVHLIEAGQPEAALREGTPDYFREQVDGLRPRADVQADIQTTALALAECPQPIGLLNLSLAAHELQIRGYQFPESTSFLRLLVAIGQPELALAHLGEIDNGTVGHDRRESAMELALVLEQRGLRAEAVLVFERHEPLDWLGGRPAPWRTAPGGDRPSLWAWAKTGAVLKGPDYIVQTVRALRPPPGLHRHERPSDADVIALRCDLLWLAGHELLLRGRWDEARPIRSELVTAGQAGREKVALLDLRRLCNLQESADGELDSRDAIDVDVLPPHARVELANVHLAAGDTQAAKAVFEKLSEPALPESSHFDKRDRHAWSTFYAYYQLAAALGIRLDPVKEIPPSKKDYLEQTVLSARHVVAFAELEGRPAGRSAADIEAALRRMHAFWATEAGRHDHRRPSEARVLMSRRAIAMASNLGATALDKVFDYFKRRWTAEPAQLSYDSTGIIRAFAQAGIGRISIRAVLKDLETFTAGSESSPEEWVDLGLAWAGLGDNEAATRCCHRAVGRTLSLSSDKDLQLGTWTKLLDPLLEGPDGRVLADAVVGALIELGRVSFGGSPDHAARILITQLARFDPHRASEAGRRFLDARLLEADDILVALLTAMADQPSVHWWTALCELLAVFGVDVPTKALRQAVTVDAAQAAPWLVELTERVAIEGRPTQRRSWRDVIKELAAQHRIGSVAIADAELEISEEAPSRETSRSSDDDEPRRLPTIEEALAKLERREKSDYRGLEPARVLLGRFDDLNEAQRARLAACLIGTDEETSIRTALARHAYQADKLDAAWEEGVAAIRASRSRDWSRGWAGGPVLKLIPELQRIDRDLLRPVVYEHFAELANSVDYFLASVGSQLDDYVEALELPAEQTARAALEVMAAILRDVAPLPERSLRAATASRSATQAEFEAAIEDVVDWLLRSPYILAWQAAQRALLALLKHGAGHRVLAKILAHEGAGPLVLLRACAVVETAVSYDRDLGGLAHSLEALISSKSLGVRLAATACLRAIGCNPPQSPAEKELPPGLRLELPPHPGQRQIASGMRASARLFREEIEAMAAEAGIDEDALYQHVVNRSEQIGGAGVDDYEPSRIGGIFGFGFLKPSAAAIRQALDEAAALLADAQRIRPADALLEAGLWPLYDTALLRTRPTRRPSEIATFVAIDERNGMGLYERSAKDLAEDAVERLAKDIDGWLVLGEWTELSLLNRLRHYEKRVSGVVFADQEARGQFGQWSIRPWPAAGYRDLRSRQLDAPTVVRSSDASMASPGGWLALHPGLAGQLELEADPEAPLGWTIEGEPGVQSVWWRSGYDRWQPYSDADEVGEGWIVLASPAVVDRLRAIGGLVRLGAIWTGRHGDGDTTSDEEQKEAEIGV